MPRRRADGVPRGFVLVVVAALLWGAGGVTGAVLAQEADLSPALVAAVRLLVAGVTLTAVGLATSRPRPRAVVRAWPRLAAVGLLAAAYQAAYFTAVVSAGVAVATFLALGAAPVLVAVVVVIGTRRRPAAGVLLALALALTGLALLTGVAERQVPVTSGVTAGLLAAAAFAALTLVNRRPWPSLGPITTTGLAFLLGGAVLLPAGAAGAPPPTTWSAATWGLVLLLGTVPTAGAYAAYFLGLRTVEATRASVVALLEPVTAAALAAVVLSQVPGPHVVVGAVLLTAATVLVRARPAAGPAGDRSSVSRGPDGARTSGSASPRVDHGPR